ncbi:hypothetical protein T11_10637 [Trichinella zimbabwensis]|uniref:Uncharacterized protein n=1 Tax=Trichinella zimbabwensis TaxID=268475 RepID=A0A0V1I4C5_9BILA|nr:hypothetical protein T11_10637 [Trichinella zimbabwensis]
MPAAAMSSSRAAEDCTDCVVRRVYHDSVLSYRLEVVEHRGVGQGIFGGVLRFLLLMREGDLGRCCGRCNGVQGCQCDRDVRKETPRSNAVGIDGVTQEGKRRPGQEALVLVDLDAMRLQALLHFLQWSKKLWTALCRPKGILRNLKRLKGVVIAVFRIYAYRAGCVRNQLNVAVCTGPALCSGQGRGSRHTVAFVGFVAWVPCAVEMPSSC